MSRYDLTDFEWRVIEPLLPNKPRGVPRNDPMKRRQFITLPGAATWPLAARPAGPALLRG
jgi:transposase